MKRLLLLLLITAPLLTAPLCAHADEPQLDHAFGPTVESSQSLAFSPDATKLAVAGSDGIKIYESATGKVLETRAACRWRTTSVVWSSDGQSLAAGGLTFKSGPTGEIWLWKVGATPQHWTTGSADISSLAFSPDGKTLASAGAGGLNDEAAKGAARLWDVSSGALQRSLGDYLASAASIAFAPNGKTVGFSWINSRAEQYQTTLCDLTSGRITKTWKDATVPLLFNSKGIPILKSPPMARTVRDETEWRIDPIEGADHMNLRFVARKIGAKRGLVGQDLGEGVQVATFGGNYLAAIMLRRLMVGSESYVQIWQINAKRPWARPLQLLGKRTASPRALSLAADGKTLGIASRPGTVLLDAPPLQLRQLLPNDEVQEIFPDAALSLSSDGKRLFDGRWLDLNQPTPRDVHPHLRLSSTIAFALSPDGRTLVGTFGDLSNVGLLGDKTPPAYFAIPDASRQSADPKAQPTRAIKFSPVVAWAPDSTRIAVIGSANSDGQLFLFDSSGKFEREIGKSDTSTVAPDNAAPEGNTSPAEAPIFQSYGAVSFSSDVKQLLTAGFGNSDSGAYGPRLDLWDSTTGQHRRTIALVSGEDKAVGSAFGGGQVSSVGVSPDGKTFVAGGILPEKGVFAPELLFLDAQTGARVGFVPLPYRSSGTYENWVFLDSERVVVLNGNSLELWDWKHHRIEKSLYLVPQGQNLKIQTVF